MAENKKSESTDNAVKPVVSEMTLPKLLGLSVTRLLTVLQSGDAQAKQLEMAQCRNDLKIWYDAQTPTDRTEFAKQQRKVVENFKLLGEQFASDMSQMTAGDLSGG